MDFTSETGLISHVIDELYTMGKFDSFGKDEKTEYSNLRSTGSTLSDPKTYIFE